MLTTPSGWQKNKIKSSEKSDLAQCGDSKKAQKKRDGWLCTRLPGLLQVGINDLSPNSTVRITVSNRLNNRVAYAPRRSFRYGVICHLIASNSPIFKDKPSRAMEWHPALRLYHILSYLAILS